MGILQSKVNGFRPIGKDQLPARFAAEQDRLVRQFNLAGRNVSIRRPTAAQLNAIVTQRGLEALARSLTRPVN
jgi:hypothetical protein